MTRRSFVAAAGVAAIAPGAALAAPPADIDLANARLLVALELLLADFYGRALKAGLFGAVGKDAFTRALFNEGEHLAAVSGILTGAGQVPAVAGDIDFSYPAKAFATRGSIAQLGLKLEQLALSAYLGAIAAVQATALKLPLAQIAACEARHVSALDAEATGHALGDSFPDPLSIDEVSNALSEYTS